MLHSHEEVIQELKRRSISHRIEVEHAKRSEQYLSVPATFLAGVACTVATAQTITKSVVLSYISAVISGLLFLLNGLLASNKAVECIRDHTLAAQNYERLYERCIAEYFKSPSETHYREFVGHIEAESCSLALVAPIVSLRSEQAAKAILKRQSSMEIRLPASAGSQTTRMDAKETVVEQKQTP